MQFSGAIQFLQTPEELENLTEAHKDSCDSGFCIDADIMLNSLIDWLGSSEANSTLPPYDHVMLFTEYVLCFYKLWLTIANHTLYICHNLSQFVHDLIHHT